MIAKELKDFLENQHIKYTTIQHTRSFTAQQTAESAHISGQEFAKTVMVKIDGKIAMAVLPAPEHVDLDLLKGATGANKVELAGEHEFTDRFAGCEPGAMPPFGNLYDMNVYVERDLTQDDKITFNAGTHEELIELSYRDFEKLVKPKVVRLSTRYTGDTD